jgi:hypothetical protein
MKSTVFWFVVPCSLVEVYRRFRGICYFHHHGDSSLKRRRTSTKLHSATTQNTDSFILSALNI